MASTLTGMGYQFVDGECLNEDGRWVLRLYIERQEGQVTIADCAKASRSISSLLDVEDVIPQKYVLEVSSPGPNRPIRKIDDFVRFKGQMARIKTKEPVNDRRNYYGELLGADGDNILIKVDGVEYRVPVDKLAKAKLEGKT